jgi:hypothetical protein
VSDELPSEEEDYEENDSEEMVPEKPIKKIVESSDDDREEIYPKLSQFCENHSKLNIEFKLN